MGVIYGRPLIGCFTVVKKGSLGQEPLVLIYILQFIPIQWKPPLLGHSNSSQYSCHWNPLGILYTTSKLAVTTFAVDDDDHVCWPVFNSYPIRKKVLCLLQTDARWLCTKAFQNHIFPLLLQAVKNSAKMRFNKAELAALAGQPSHKFEKEGVLWIRERQEGFFRKTEGMRQKCQKYI